MRLPGLLRKFDKAMEGKQGSAEWVEYTPELIALARERMIAGAKQYGVMGFVDRGEAKVKKDLKEEKADVLVYIFFLKLLEEARIYNLPLKGSK